ncbi:hypothetical protein [Nostoc favosum]|uniref:Uncharacterized protein n=1 Tax=Nostoc favosum CHAB5714 TaxID=2780399 RepID=A0ABS8IAB2_9NOSO|nr:hypothetical protein [Nostoc favosum]MCC5600703.1 hypothetical protein [Nostoc favosum CHAB5714]
MSVPTIKKRQEYSNLGFEWARKQRNAIAMSLGFVYPPLGVALEVQEMMRWFPIK